MIATGTVKANTNLNVRNGAGVGYARVGSLTSGTVVNIYERVIVNGAEWGRIGVNQWVCMAYLVLNNTNGTVVTPALPALPPLPPAPASSPVPPT